MRASHIALLSLAASTAAPVFAAPIRYLNARSEDGGAGLSAREFHGGSTESTSENHTSQPHSDNHGESIARDSLITAISNKNTRRSDVVKRNVPRGVTPESLAARLSPEDFLRAMLSDRSLGSRRDKQARDLLSDLFETGMTILNDFRRDVTPGELAGRDAVDEFFNTLSNRATRKPSPSAPKTVARDSSKSNALIKAFLNTRDSGNKITSGDVRRLALLASRALDDLD